MSWDDDIRQVFPDWKPPEVPERWPAIRTLLSIGRDVTGTVIARAPFGIWLDIGVGHPALLLVVRMAGAQQRRIVFEDYPAHGSIVSGRVYVIGEHGEIGITQLMEETHDTR